MIATTSDVLLLTAGDLMSRDVKTVGSWLSIAEAARLLNEWGLRGVPVVNEQGECVGVLSVSDLARTVARKNDEPRPPRTCAFQENRGLSEGKPVVRCLLDRGVCALQRAKNLPDGKSELLCSEPNCVPTDWQVVELEARNGERVKDVMSHDVVSVSPDAPLPDLARVMLDRDVHRLIVLSLAGGPVGVVSVDDLLQAVARPASDSSGGTP